jgi:hypothetical protein
MCAGIVPGLAQTVFFVYPYMYKAMYGRFLLLQLSGGTGIIMLNFLVCMLDLIGRLNSRNADMMLLRLMYGRRTAQVWLLLLLNEHPVTYVHQGAVQPAISPCVYSGNAGDKGGKPVACGRGTGTQLCRVHQYSSWRGPLQLWAYCR